MPRFIYLHGFASSPGSRKARFFAERFQQLGIGLDIPDLAEGNFRNLTLTAQLNVIARLSRDQPASLIGSSMGGYLAALYAARHPGQIEKLVLLAPAFSFGSRWPETLGGRAMEQWKRTNTLKVFHYSEGREVELGYQLVEDALQYEAYPDVQQPVLIFHGRGDTVVPPDYSVRFAEQHSNARLRLLHSDHELGNVLDTMWIETEEFLFGSKLDPLVDGGQRH
ncbi:MAG: YqiA/YcfP family alpha/beta fold hydrolase [Bryobacteraceae bacterium]|jgi:pimeloyl-ACP methyl ester carboxylesterase